MEQHRLRCILEVDEEPLTGRMLFNLGKYGTESNDEYVSLGNNSVMAINPVFLDIWNRFGCRLDKQNVYVIKLEEAICKANCLRIRHTSSGPFIVRAMYLNYH